LGQLNDVLSLKIADDGRSLREPTRWKKYSATLGML
jgi:hypothetical protein